MVVLTDVFPLPYMWLSFKIKLRASVVITLPLGGSTYLIHFLRHQLNEAVLKLRTSQLEEEQAKKLALHFDVSRRIWLTVSNRYPLSSNTGIAMRNASMVDRMSGFGVRSRPSCKQMIAPFSAPSTILREISGGRSSQSRPITVHITPRS